MLKKCLPILLAASLISIAAPFAAAQSAAQSNDSPPNNQPSAQGNGGWHHGPPDPAQRTQELTKKLNLTSDQQTKVQELLQSEHSTDGEPAPGQFSFPAGSPHQNDGHAKEHRHADPRAPRLRLSRRSGTKCKPSVSNGGKATPRARRRRPAGPTTTSAIRRGQRVRLLKLNLCNLTSDLCNHPSPIRPACRPISARIASPSSSALRPSSSETTGRDRSRTACRKALISASSGSSAVTAGLAIEICGFTLAALGTGGTRGCPILTSRLLRR